MIALFLACTGATPDDNVNPLEDGRPDSQRAWSEKDNPSKLAKDLNYSLAALPKAGEATNVPWAGSYWPTYEDNLNKRWAGPNSKTAIEKWEKAFGVTANLDDRISKEYGIDSINGTDCTKDADCDSTKGEACAMREGETDGTCIETWFGICHAWAPAAIMELEPVSPVEYNGVTFEVNDLKALASLQYDKALNVSFLSLRCDENSQGEEWQLDAYGNPLAEGCADTNAGSFHVVITNFLGLKGESLVEDRTYDYQVWNQPLRSFEVTTMETLSAIEAAVKAGDADATDYTFNEDAVEFRYVELTLEYIGESDSRTDGNLGSTIDLYTHSDDYQYILELDGSGNIVGGEWVGASKVAHPDFLWLPTHKGEAELAMADGKTGTGIKWSDVDALLAASMTDEKGAPGGFDWGEGCEGGNGAFNQLIAHEAAITVGTIPEGKSGVSVQLKSDADVDIQLIDKATGTEIVAWPDGLYAEEGEGCVTYEGHKVCHSGYNGDGSNYGHEWLNIEGDLSREFVLKAYGYASGNAAVTYSFEAASDCVDEGEGSFDQPIAESDVLAVGIIPAGKTNIRIDLVADADVDVQLFDGAHAIVQWPDGDLKAADQGSTTYEGATVTYSGYLGKDGNKPGQEFITIEGELKSDLIVKAFGYQAGEAEVTYSWGGDL